MGELFYYYVLEVNIDNPHVKKHQPLIFGEFGIVKTAVFSSSEFNDYQECLNMSGEILTNVMVKFRDAGVEGLRIYWEKNHFENIEGDDTWMAGEAVKIYVVDSKSSTYETNTLFKCRIFFKEQFFVHEPPDMIQ